MLHCSTKLRPRKRTFLRAAAERFFAPSALSQTLVCERHPALSRCNGKSSKNLLQNLIAESIPKPLLPDEF